MKPGERIENEIQAERRELLRDLFEHRGWIEVLRPALVLRMERIARSLAGNDQRPLEDTRVLQGKYRALLEIISISPDEMGALFEG